MQVQPGEPVSVQLGPFAVAPALQEVEYRLEPELLDVLGEKGLKTGEWSRLTRQEFGIPNGSFFALLKGLEKAGKVQKSRIDDRWEVIQNHSKTSDPYKDQ